MQKKAKISERTLGDPRRKVLAGICLAAYALSATAAEFSYTGKYVTEYATNVTSTAQPKDDWINSAIAGVAYADNTASLVSRLSAQVEYRTYADHTFDDNTLYDVNGIGIWTISPERLNWTFEDVAREVRTNPTAADTPANRAATNVFRTGPDIYLHPSLPHTFSLGARYANFYVGDSTLGSDSYTTALRWIYALDSSITPSLNYEHQTVDFDDALSADLTRNDAYLQIETKWTQSRLVVVGGTTRIEREGSSEELSGSLWRLNWTHTITADSDLGASYSSSYQDSSVDLLSTVAQPNAPLATGTPASISTDVLTTDVYYSRDADVFYNQRLSRAGFRFRIRSRNLDFETTPQDRKEFGGSVDLDYALTDISTLGFNVDRNRIEQLNTSRVDEDVSYGVRYAYRLGRQWDVGLEARRSFRDSDAVDADYAGNRYLLSIAYNSGSFHSPFTRD